MKKIIFLLFLISGVAGNAQLITSFGSNASNGGGWTYTTGTSTLTGTEGIGDLIFGSSSFSSYSGLFVSMTANVTTAPSAGFSVVLQDAEGDEINAFFSWTSFVGGATIVAPLSSNVLFNPNSVQGWNLVGGGSGSTINATLTSASVVPEPTTWALLALGTGMLVISRRQRLLA